MENFTPWRKTQILLFRSLGFGRKISLLRYYRFSSSNSLHALDVYSRFVFILEPRNRVVNYSFFSPLKTFLQSRKTLSKELPSNILPTQRKNVFSRGPLHFNAFQRQSRSVERRLKVARSIKPQSTASKNAALRLLRAVPLTIDYNDCWFSKRIQNQLIYIS